MNKKYRLQLIPLLFIIVITILIIKIYDLSTYRMIISILTLIASIIIIFMFFLKCFHWYTSYMIFNKNTFVPKVDKPRVFMFSIITPLLILTFYMLNYYQSSNIFGYKWKEVNLWFGIVFCITFSSLFYILCILSVFTLSKKFEKLYLPKVVKNLEIIYDTYTSYYSIKQLNDIFDGLLEHNFLIYEDFDTQNFDKENFIDLIISGKFPDYPFLFLKMDNLQTFVLHEEFEKGFREFDLNSFWKFFRNKNDKATVDSIVESYRKCVKENIKQRNKIELIFKKIR